MVDKNTDAINYDMLDDFPIPPERFSAGEWDEDPEDLMDDDKETF